MLNKSKITIACFLLALLTTIFPLTVSASAVNYTRFSLGYENSLDGHFSDADCNSSSPAALFGCGSGSDGRSRGVYGDFDNSYFLELALGRKISPLFSIEAVVSHKPSFKFQGEANFIGVTGSQPVTSEITQSSIMGFGYLNLGTLFKLNSSTIEPYIGLGAGVARNKISSLKFTFPSMAQPSYSNTPKGRSLNFAYAATAGLGYKLAENLTLDIAYRYTDYGKVKTDSGIMDSQRGAAPFYINIGETYTKLRAHGLVAGIKYWF